MVHRSIIVDALKYLNDIENNIPKYYWPGLVREGWMVIEEDGTPNWDSSITSHVSDQDMLAFVDKCRGDKYFYEVTLNKPLKPVLDIGEDSYD